MSSVIKNAISVGAIAFLTWDNFSEELHDFIDEIIEMPSDKDLTYITTMSQKDEEPADVAWFFINATYFGGDDYRCLALFDVPTANWSALEENFTEKWCEKMKKQFRKIFLPARAAEPKERHNSECTGCR